MKYYILTSVISFLVGFIFAYIIYKKKNEELLLFNLINDFKKTIEDYKTQTNLNTQEINNAIKTAQTLTKTLTTNQNLKGKFGEDCLESILKTCFPNENINYIKQFKTQNSENKEIKPDFLVNLPNNKSILIDCKLNLDKYIEYQEEIEPNLIKDKKHDFIKDLNNTINLLANKKYENAIDLIQPSFILMYIPLEPILTLIYTDKDFLNVVKNANDKNIIIVGNSSILTTIRLTKLLWAQDSQEKNLENIIEIAQKIYEYIALHTQNLYKTKQVLEESLQNFNKEYDKITKNKLFQLTEELRNYGISGSMKKAGKKLDEIKIEKDFIE